MEVVQIENLVINRDRLELSVIDDGYSIKELPLGLRNMWLYVAKRLKLKDVYQIDFNPKNIWHSLATIVGRERKVRLDNILTDPKSRETISEAVELYQWCLEEHFTSNYHKNFDGKMRCVSCGQAYKMASAHGRFCKNPNCFSHISWLKVIGVRYRNVYWARAIIRKREEKQMSALMEASVFRHSRRYSNGLLCE